METQTFTFAASQFVPVAIGFFGLGTGYFIWGGQALFGFPKTSPEVNRTMGMWGFWMPGFTISHRHLPSCWTDLVQSLRKCRSFIYGRSRIHGVRDSLVCNGPSPLHRFKCPA